MKLRKYALTTRFNDPDFAMPTTTAKRYWFLVSANYDWYVNETTRRKEDPDADWHWAVVDRRDGKDVTLDYDGLPDPV